MLPLMPVMVLLVVSYASSVWLPAVPRVALKIPIPAVKVLSAGSVALGSELIKWTVPA